MFFTEFSLVTVYLQYICFCLQGIYGTVRRGSESHTDERNAPPLCIHKSLTNETNLSVNVLCHVYL